MVWMGHVRVHAVSPRSFTRLEKLALESVGGKSKYLKSLYLVLLRLNVANFPCSRSPATARGSSSDMCDATQLRNDIVVVKVGN
jgi:hypothetical protein